MFLVDDRPYFQVTPARRPTYARWVWDHPFFIILNLAVGGLFPGPPDATTVLPQTLLVDYVRVSERVSSDAGADDDAAVGDGMAGRAANDGGADEAAALEAGADSDVPSI